MQIRHFFYCQLGSTNPEEGRNEMSKKASETRGTAKCASCLFGRPVTVVDKDKSGKETARREMCECHVARPTRYGFPTVRLDDFCACHVDEATAERTFAGLVVQTANLTA